jgi:DNA-directed RNA polymerase specialized sigma24 family protein
VITVVLPAHQHHHRSDGSLLGAFRRRTAHPAMPPTNVGDDRDVERRFEERGIHAPTRQSLEQLPDRREAAVLLELIGLAVEETGEALDATPASVGIPLHRAQGTLREMRLSSQASLDLT